MEREGRGARPFGAVIARVMSSLGLGDADEARLFREWARAAGPEFAEGCKPGRLEGGTMAVMPANETWAHMLAMRREDLKGKLNSYLGHEKVKEVLVMTRGFGGR